MLQKTSRVIADLSTDISVGLMNIKSGGAFERAIDKLDVTASDKKQLKRLMARALAATKKAGDRRDMVFRPAIDECVEFSHGFADAAFSKDSVFSPFASNRSLRARIDDGENILVCANHIAPADALALGSWLERSEPSLSRDIIFISAESPDANIYSNTLLNSVNRQIVFSENYIRSNRSDTDQMRKLNKMSLLSLSKRLSKGGNIIALFPQGSLETMGLTRPPESSGQIFEMIERFSPKGFTIVPVAIEGTEDVLRSLVAIKSGFGMARTAKVSVTCSDPISDARMHVCMQAIADLLPEEKRKSYRSRS